MKKRSSLWCIGSNWCNSCGLDNTNTGSDSVRILTLSKWSLGLNNLIAMTRGHSFNIFTFPTNRDELIVYGFIKKFQETLPYKSNSFYIIPTSIISVCLLFVGNNHNEYFAAGTNENGECGVGHCNKTTSQQITQINGVNNIRKICCGTNASNVLWIRYDGQIYVNGKNTKGQLGAININNEENIINIPTILDENKSFKCIDAGSCSTCSIIVCHDGSVWSSGYSVFGENGHGEQLKATTKFTKIVALNTSKIISVSVGDHISLFLGIDGDVWVCGFNMFGQLAIGIADVEMRLPSKIEFFQDNNIKIHKIECGGNHCIAMDRRGKFYCWGDNQYGQAGLGLSAEQNICVPEMIKLFQNINVLNIKAGAFHTGVITEDDEFYLWGSNEYNECCVFDDNISDVFEPNCINQYVFNTTKCKSIIDMTLGGETTMILVENK